MLQDTAEKMIELIAHFKGLRYVANVRHEISCHFINIVL